MIRRRIKSDKIRIHDIQWTSVFRPNIRLADEYRRDRIFVAGDAAHVHTPMGAQGLNTGVQDAYNLGWKIAQVLSGAPQELLDTYEAERQPIAASVLGRSTRKYEAAANSDAESRKRGKDEQQLLITYRAGPLGRASSRGTATLDAGDRAPDAKLIRYDNTPVSLFELFRGPHFTAIGYGIAAADCVQKMSWPDGEGAGLKRIAVDAHETPPTIDESLTDNRSSFKRIYGLDRETIILVRPDGYIAHIWSPGDVAAIDAVTRKFRPV